MAAKSVIYQIYFDDKTKKYISPNAIGYDNSIYEGKAFQPAFENHIIRELIEQEKHKEAEYFGVFSWQFESKNSYWLKNLETDVKDFDIYTFYRLHTQPNVWRVAENWHSGIIETAQYIFNQFNGLKIDRLNTPTIYQNAHVSRSELYEEFVCTWLIPLMDIMAQSEDKWLQNRLFTDTKYKSGRFSPDKIKQITGVKYYPMHTFICERFFSTFCATKNFKIKHLC